VAFFKNIDFYVLRRSIIPKGMEENKFKVYNGKFNFIVNITKRHFNLKFGEFAISRSLYAKGNLKLKKKKKIIKRK
jgi:ribosomal protein S19